jgi:peptidoglycan hydrolase CwlO-like protein
MDVERTIQFILESQARAEGRMEKADARMVKADGRVAAMEKRLDRRMDAITKLLQQGMRMLAKTDATLAELAEAQKGTDRSLKAFINSLRHGGNGR